MTHFDASCPKCRARFGWWGEAVDRPPCPKCGHSVPRELIEAEARQIADFRRLLSELRQANPDWERWREARLAAGLTLRQAAVALSLTPTSLSTIERGETRPTPDLAGRMAALYGGDEPG